MKGTKFAAILLIVSLFALVKSHDFPEEEDVLVLGEDNFDQAIKHFEHVLVEFYAPWCGHCKKLAPEYARAAAELKKDNQPLALAKVDSTIHKNLGTRFGVEGFPTLKFFTNGTPSEYNGGRTEAEIISWMRKKTGPATKSLTTVSEVEALTNSVDVAVVYFGDNTKDLETFGKFARSNDDVVFGTSASEETLNHFKVQSGNVVLFKKFDEKRNDFTGELTEENLQAFISKHGAPLVMKFDEKSAQLIFGKATPGIFLYRDNNSEKTVEFDKLFSELSPKLKGKLQVIVTDIKEGLETRLAEYIGITANDLPTVRIHDTRSDLKKYTMEGEINEQNVLKFVEQWESGSLKAHLKSEEIPEKQEGDVVTLVGKSFNDIVLNPEKDVLVEFYAPWCGHCKKLVPIYDELAANLKSSTNIIIAKMDSTANEVDGVSVQGFPTIKFWPAGDKKNPIDFDGDRTVEGFTKFLEKNAAANFVKKDDL
jgi:protein disulfide-isomerase A1